MSSMGTEARRRTRRGCVIALVGVMGLGAMGPGAVPDPIGAEEASAAQWVGSMQGTAGKSTRWVSGGSTMRGDFTFTVARNGQLRGFATAAYQPTFDTDRINALIGYAKGATAGALGAAGIFGGLAANQLNLIVGLKIDYPDPMPVRRGPITGKVRNGTISIAWAGPTRTTAYPSGPSWPTSRRTSSWPAGSSRSRCPSRATPISAADAWPWRRGRQVHG